MLKTLLTMPDNSHFGMHDASADAVFHDDQIPLLARWTLRPIADYRAELAVRRAVQMQREAALWLARKLALPEAELHQANIDAEAVIRTALLATAAGLKRMPNWAQLERAVLLLRKRQASQTEAQQLKLEPPPGLPEPYQALVEHIKTAMLRDDVPKLLDTSPQAVAPRKLLQQSLGFMGKYFWRDDGIEEISNFDLAVSAEWAKFTQDHSDDGSLLTLFLCLSAGSPRKTSLSEKAAATLVRKLRKNGFNPALVQSFISEHAPHEHHNNYQKLWRDFVAEAERDLMDERDTRLVEALACLRMHCNITV